MLAKIGSKTILGGLNCDGYSEFNAKLDTERFYAKPNVYGYYMLNEIDKAMHKAVAEHENGNLQDAEKIYRKILEIVPDHLDANHNLGILLVDLHKSKSATQFLKTALNGNEKVEQYWTSYINAQINLDELDGVRENIELARTAGVAEEKLTLLMDRIYSPSELYSQGKFFKASDGHYLGFMRALHEKIYEGYFEIGTRRGASLALSQSPSISIDPYFQLTGNPIGNKDFCLFFQETSDSFFEKSMPKLSNIKCQLAFIDGMHLYECALNDFINLAKVSSEKSLFLFHDPIPWSFRMATRDNNEIARNEPWTGDIWKLVHIFIDAGMKDSLRLLTSAPTGLLAVLNPCKEMILKLEENYKEICEQWTNVELDGSQLSKFYETGIFAKPEIFLRYLEKISFGTKVSITREWVSH